ncbi:phage tail protein [Myxococcus sp. AM001]|nr:phage tail protein [Myxococcus sp. AM001]
MTSLAPTFRKPIGMKRTVHKQIRLGDDAYDICKPTSGDKVALLAAARKAGEVNDKGEPSNEVAAWTFVARVACASLYHAGSATRVFTDTDLEEVKLEPWLEEFQADFIEAFNGPAMETAKGNSETTPS